MSYGNSFSFVKDSKGLVPSLKEQQVALHETLVSFYVRALFTNIPVQVTHDIMNRICTKHINLTVMENFLEHTCFIPKTKISLLELVLNNCVFSFQGKFHQQLQGATMGTPVSPVIANIYMEDFEEIALGSQCPYLPLDGQDILKTLSI